MATDLFKLVHVGYVVRRKASYILYGVGTTEEDAMADAHDFIEEEDDVTDYYTLPATANLMSIIKESGGTIDWHMFDGIVCTLDEYEAARGAKAIRDAMIYAANMVARDAVEPTMKLLEESITADRAFYDAERAYIEAKLAYEQAAFERMLAKEALDMAKIRNAHPQSTVSIARKLHDMVSENQHRIQLSQKGNPVIIFDDAPGHHIVLTEDGELKHLGAIPVVA